MRLTLRYLLGFLDGNLSPEDAQAIGPKVEESEKAKRLLHRIRDVTRRLRLGAPTVMDRGQWLDPNTVAEYLDNRLPHVQVPDFEKVCTDSDVQLAEVAACHQILAIVLREPAEVDPISRQRMYRLPETLEAEAPVASEAPPVATGSNGHSEGPREEAPDRSKPTVPEYLRRPAPQGHPWRTLLSLALALGIVLLVLALLGQFRPGMFFGGLFHSSPSENQPLARSDADESAVEGPLKNPAESQPPPSQTPGEKGAPPRPTSVTLPVQPAHESPPPAPDKPPVGPSDPKSRPAAPSPGRPEELKEAAPAKPDPSDQTPPDRDLKQPPGALEPSARLPSGDPGRGTAVQPAKPRLPSERLGEFVSSNEVLLKLNATTGSWQRVGPNAAVTSRDRLLSLPTFRPAVSLGVHLEIKLIDGAQMGFLPSDAQGVTGVTVDFGRFVMRPEEGAKPRFRLQIGDRLGTIAFEDPESTMAIDVGRAESAGSDPETQPGPVVADLYATTGKMVWQEEPNGKPVTLAAPIRATLSEHSLDTVALQQFPRWVFDTSLGTLEQKTAATIDRGLAADRAVHVSLRELAGHRQKEVRGLALRSLGYVGDYEPLLAVLNDADQRLQWPDFIDQLRAALVRDPHSAAQVRATMEKLYGDDGTRLYEMLWKYRADSLTPAEARQLIKFLDHETLTFRVLSFSNLKTITGMGLHYRPEDTAAKRQPAIMKWKERQNTFPALRPQPQGEDERTRGPETARAPGARAKESPKERSDAIPDESPADDGAEPERPAPGRR